MIWNNTDIEEKRVGIRFLCRGEVLFKGINRGKTHKGNVVNIGEDGVCILTSFPVRVGTIICLRTIGQLETGSETSLQPRSMALAEVKWCETIEKDPAANYCLGLKYMVDN